MWDLAISVCRSAPLETAKWKGTLVATPFWANTQLLWFRKSLAKAAGVDPTTSDFTWDEMIKAAEGQGKKIGVQGKRYEGYMVWINALIVSGVVTAVAFFLIKVTVGLRPTEEVEREGLDVAEHGERAYD